MALMLWKHGQWGRSSLWDLCLPAAYVLFGLAAGLGKLIRWWKDRREARDAALKRVHSHHELRMPKR